MALLRMWTVQFEQWLQNMLTSSGMTGTGTFNSYHSLTTSSPMTPSGITYLFSTPLHSSLALGRIVVLSIQRWFLVTNGDHSSYYGQGLSLQWRCSYCKNEDHDTSSAQLVSAKQQLLALVQSSCETSVKQQLTWCSVSCGMRCGAVRKEKVHQFLVRIKNVVTLHSLLECTYKRSANPFVNGW